MSRFPPIRFHRPRRAREFYPALLVLVCGVACCVAGFGHALSRSVEKPAFQNAGVFSYGAGAGTTSPASSSSGDAQRATGSATSSLGELSLSFAYQFSSLLPHQVTGTVSLEEVLLANSGWRNDDQLARPVRFSGDTGAVTAQVSLLGMEKVIAQLERGGGGVASSYAVNLQAVVRYTGVVDGHPVHGVFSPSMPFTINPALLAPHAAGGAGATVSDPLLHPSQQVSLPRLEQNDVAVAGVHASALVSRIAGALLALLGLAGVVLSQRRRRDIWSHEKRVAFRSGRNLVEVLDVLSVLPQNAVVTKVADFESLVALAVQADRAVMFERRTDGDLYAVDAPPRLYVFRSPRSTRVPLVGTPRQPLPVVPRRAASPVVAAASASDPAELAAGQAPVALRVHRAG